MCGLYWSNVEAATIPDEADEPYQVAVGRIGRRGLVRQCDSRIV